MSDESKSLAGRPDASALPEAGGYPHPIIAREGWPFIVAGLIGVVLAFAAVLVYLRSHPELFRGM